MIPCQTPDQTLAIVVEEDFPHAPELDATVTLTLTAIDTGTRLWVEHAGFVLPRNAVAWSLSDDARIARQSLTLCFFACLATKPVSTFVGHALSEHARRLDQSDGPAGQRAAGWGQGAQS